MENDDGYDVWNISNGTNRPYVFAPPVVDARDSQFVLQNLHMENGRLNRTHHRNGGVEVMGVLDIRESGGLLSVFERGTLATIVLRFDVLEIHFFDDKEGRVSLQGFQGEQNFVHNGLLFFRWWFDAETFVTVNGATVDRISTELMEYQMERRGLLRTDFLNVFPSLFDAFNDRVIEVRNPEDPDNSSTSGSDNSDDGGAD